MLMIFFPYSRIHHTRRGVKWTMGSFTTRVISSRARRITSIEEDDRHRNQRLKTMSTSLYDQVRWERLKKC